MRILLTGGTGFIGSNVANYLVQEGFELILTKRESSNLNNCTGFIDKVKWINTNSLDWEKQVIDFNPEILLHTAWNGVDGSRRNDWEVQLSNMEFLFHLLNIAKETKLRKVIAFGSQAEYGHFDIKISEDSCVNPNTSYGFVKVACLEYLKLFCVENSITWLWFRIFTIIGKNDHPEGLFSSVIKALLSDKEIELTNCEQKYDLLHIDDFSLKLVSVIKQSSSKSGVYNFCTGNATPLKEFLIQLALQLNKPSNLLKFGALPYRQNQTMLMVGDSQKFKLEFGDLGSIKTEDLVRKLI